MPKNPTKTQLLPNTAKPKMGIFWLLKHVFNLYPNMSHYHTQTCLNLKN